MLIEVIFKSILYVVFRGFKENVNAFKRERGSLLPRARK